MHCAIIGLKNYGNVLQKLNIFQYSKYIKNIIEDFDNLPVDKSKPKPRVGVVGESTLNSIQVRTIISMNS